MQVEALIKELLATGSMNEDTTADLNRWAAEAAAGTLHPDDVAGRQRDLRLIGQSQVAAVDHPA